MSNNISRVELAFYRLQRACGIPTILDAPDGTWILNPAMKLMQGRINKMRLKYNRLLKDFAKTANHDFLH